MYLLDSILQMATALGAEDAGLLGEADAQSNASASKTQTHHFDEGAEMLANFAMQAMQFNAADSNATSLRGNPHPSMYRRLQR